MRVGARKGGIQVAGSDGARVETHPGDEDPLRAPPADDRGARTVGERLKGDRRKRSGPVGMHGDQASRWTCGR
jgi:hypothetical protein